MKLTDVRRWVAGRPGEKQKHHDDVKESTKDSAEKDVGFRAVDLGTERDDGKFDKEEKKVAKQNNPIALSIAALAKLAKQEGLEQNEFVLAAADAAQTQAIIERDQEETGGVGRGGKWMMKVAKFVGKRIVIRGVKMIAKAVVRTVGRFAVRIIWNALRFIASTLIRAVIVPIIEMVVGFIAMNPLTALAALAVGGIAATGWWMYKKFFNKDEPAPPQASKPLHVSNIFTRLIAKFMGFGDIIGEVVDDAAVGVTQVGVSTGVVNATVGATNYQATKGQMSNAEALLSKRSATVEQAINIASQRTGMPVGTLTAFAAIESRFDPQAGVATSSARGLFQFTRGTWNSTLKAYGPRYNVSPDADIYDPVANAVMGAAYLKHEVWPSISKAVPNPNTTDLYFGHFLGPGGGRQFLSGLKANPNALASSLVDEKAAKANYWVFTDKKTGRAKTAQEVYDTFLGKFAPIEQLATGGALAESVTQQAAGYSQDATTSLPAQQVAYKEGTAVDRPRKPSSQETQVQQTAPGGAKTQGPPTTIVKKGNALYAVKT
ncbi:hypothetical protein [Burkholderia phage BCSR5]|nr:hypothetical protein [Burkholderia phage BCSR5]